MLDKLERKMGKYAISNLPIFLVAGQAGAFVLGMFNREFANQLFLVPNRVLQGEVWRLITFMFMPPVEMSPSPWTVLWLFFALWLIYTFGRGLESAWGEFRFNVFIFVGWLATVGAAFIFPHVAATNVYLMASLLLGFAYLNPDFEILLFLILPVKIKWFAYLSGAVLSYGFVMGSWAGRALLFAGVLNFFLFFGRDMWVRVRGASRRRVKRTQDTIAAGQPTHTCEVCGLTDLKDGSMQFRYCSKCTGKRGYCSEHLRKHEHIRG